MAFLKAKLRSVFSHLNHLSSLGHIPKSKVLLLGCFHQIFRTSPADWFIVMFVMRYQIESSCELVWIELQRYIHLTIQYVSRYLYEMLFRGSYLRNRSALAVNCWLIIHCLEVSCNGDQITSAKREWFICLQLTDKQWLINQQFTHYAALELICFVSNTRETMKEQLYPAVSSNSPPLHWWNPTKGLIVTQVFTCIS